MINGRKCVHNITAMWSSINSCVNLKQNILMLSDIKECTWSKSMHHSEEGDIIMSCTYYIIVEKWAWYHTMISFVYEINGGVQAWWKRQWIRSFFRAKVSSWSFPGKIQVVYQKSCLRKGRVNSFEIDELSDNTHLIWDGYYILLWH